MQTNLPSVEVKGFRVLTTKQIAEAYGTTTEHIKHNFGSNKTKYLEGKHYICLTGESLTQFKNEGGNSALTPFSYDKIWKTSCVSHKTVLYCIHQKVSVCGVDPTVRSFCWPFSAA